MRNMPWSKATIISFPRSAGTEAPVSLSRVADTALFVIDNSKRVVDTQFLDIISLLELSQLVFDLE